MTSAEFATNRQVVAAARANLSAHAWDKLLGGTESETTLRRNRLGFDSLSLRPTVQRVDADINTATTFLGRPLRIPVMTSPIGSLHHFAADGAMATVGATARFGSIAFVSSASHEGFEAIAERFVAPLVLQLAIRGDLEWCHDMLARARAAGYFAVCITLDTARLGRQERQIENNRRPQPEEHPFRTGLTWAHLAQIQGIAGMPVVIKGIATREDAVIAVDHGVDAICVSNHGGHGLDHGRATIDILPEVVEAVDDRVPVILDGGVLRGTDIVKALARGARAVMIGKLQGLGLAAGGEQGMLRVLENLEDELVDCLAFLGARGIDSVTAAHVKVDHPVGPPTETSAFGRGVEGAS